MSSKKMICDFYIRKKVSPNKPFLNQFYITVLALSFFLLLRVTAVILKILHFFTNRPFALLFTSMMANQPWRYSISVHVDPFELCVLQSAFLSRSTFYPGLQSIVCVLG